ncbi:hypothetical protein JCM19233_6817 [Vibrio astriarenae]|nr:hypothetical protein JCM19233_6817 [Vibrio sp. C7]
MISKTFLLEDEQATIKLGDHLAQCCTQQTTIYLHGDLAQVRRPLAEDLFDL